MTTGSITKKTQLLFFDAIFHLPTSTVNVVVEPFGAALQIGDHLARISTSIAMLGFGDDPSLLVPTLSLVFELSEELICLRKGGQIFG
jgi:hypothetical protein